MDALLYLHRHMFLNLMQSVSTHLFQHQNIRPSNQVLPMFFYRLIFLANSVQCSKLTAAYLKIIVKKLKSLEANGRKPHLQSQAVKSEPVKERKRSARERNRAHKSHSTACIIMTWSHKCSANESSQFLI